ncbi:MAG: methylmalonyl-CoA mutase [Flavobacteriaceae bacterium]|nr:methylmalonyl-CoA mutase [Flavobacteriaceae bacterium]
MSKNLFNQFDAVTSAAWKQKIQFDLKGADYNETLLWKTDEGITVKPFYTKEDRKEHDAIFNQKIKFNISQSIFISDEKKANHIAKLTLEKGATAIEFIADKKFDYKTLLNQIDTKATFFYFRCSFLDADFIHQLDSYIKSENCYFQTDIIHRLAETGNWFHSLNADFTAFENIVSQSNNTIGIDATLYQNAGATIVQQLAYTLAHANEYLHYFNTDISNKIHFNFAVGSNYFFEIAKLRAFKILWKSLVEEYKYNTIDAHIFTQPSIRNKTIYDYNVNMLRTTSECMSAILGGANTVNNLAYDAVFHKKNNFGERIARNQLLILQQESYLETANTIANGTYYIENITQQLAEKALLIFKEIEKNGGFLKQLKAGTIQRKIDESATKEQQQFNNKELILLGTNKLPNTKDVMNQHIELYPFVKNNPVKTLVPPILKKRLAETLEKERLHFEKQQNN